MDVVSVNNKLSMAVRVKDLDIWIDKNAKRMGLPASILGLKN